jgi:hypothetical protein
MVQWNLETAMRGCDVEGREFGAAQGTASALLEWKEISSAFEIASTAAL